MNDAHLPDFLDDADGVLPSFAAIRQRTRETLYATGVDRSPKGSVDAPIQDLIDLLNQHPSFATLSSCSGRIAIFDPARAEATGSVTEGDPEPVDGNADDTNDSDRPESGKGSGGGWLFVSHEPVDADAVEEIFRSHDATQHRDDKPCSFRLEPMLLHVAAANLDRGRQLMKLVLGLGFRESGMVVTSSRVTVAIRSYSLALNVPIAQTGPFALPEAYRRALVDEANRKLMENSYRIQALYDEIETTLFQPRQPVFVRPLPELNLWGHAAVAMYGENKGRDITDLVVIGGYGTGPKIVSDHKESSPARSDKIYRLRRLGFHWQKHWERLHSFDDSDILNEAKTTSLGIVCRQAPWTEREFAAACVIPMRQANPVLCIFGGRTSPTKPLDDLLFWEYDYSSYAISQKPTDVRGEPPSPRWGHSLSALSGRNHKIAVLVGGRNQNSALDSIHVLSVCLTDNSHVLWERISNPPFTDARFHHTAVSMLDQVFVFGGISDVNDTLKPFLTDGDKDPMSYVYFINNSDADTAFQVLGNLPSNLFGQAAALLPVANDKRGLVICGGVAPASQTASLQLLELQTSPEGSSVYHRSTKLSSDATIDFGAMVHHQCLAMPTDGKVLEVATIGGGVQGFGFQQTYARSYMVTIDLAEGTREADPLTPIIIKKRLDMKVAARAPSLRSLSPAPSEGSEPGLSDVLLVRRQHAKRVKTLLEASGFLDRTYRMSSVAESEHVAVPVTRECLEVFESNQELEWKALVLGQDKQVLPYRTAAFARRGTA